MGDRRTSSSRYLTPALFTVLLLAVWQLADYLAGFSPIVLPNPLEVSRAIVTHREKLAFNAGVTFAEAFAGYLLGAISGLTLATLALFVPRIGQVIMPYAVAIKATPIIVLAPIIVMWLGNGYSSKVVMAALAAFFPVLVSAHLGFTSVDREWLELMHLHRSTRWKTFWKLRFPHALPDIFAGLRISTSLAMVGAVVSEFSGAQVGLGKLIATSTYYLNIDQVFAGTLVLCLMGIAFYGVVTWLHCLVVFWDEPR